MRAQKRLPTAVIRECGFRALQDIKRDRVERWLTVGANQTRSARTRNSYVNVAKWFPNFCVDTDRLTRTRLARIPMADGKAEQRRQPRAFTAEGIERLLDAARRRPLVEGRTVARGWRRGQPRAQLRPETVRG